MINIELNRQTTLAVIILAASLFSSVAFALPNKMPINGRLTFSNDTDINGTANFTFKIYNNKTGSAALWQESQQNLTVRRGLFSAYLGNNTPINLTFDENYFLEIVVNGETIEPRFDFGTTGYSFASNQTLFTKNDTKVLGNLTPVGNNSALGSNSFSWLAGYFNSLIAGTLNVTDIFLGGFNLTSRIVSDNATQGSRIDAIDTRQSSDNTTYGNRTALLETKQSADNATQASLIAGNNQTLSDRIDSLGSSGAASDNTTQSNLITGNNNTLGGRISALDSRQSSDNTTLFNRTSSDNATQAARIATLEANNNTIGSTAAFLAIANTFSAAWNNFFAVNATQLNVTDIFLSSINLSQRLTGDNSTLGNRIGSLEAKQSADNTTLANRLSTSASDNTTLGDRIGTLETKHSSDNTTLGGKISTLQSDNTTQANAVSSVDTRQSSDNTTQNNWINGIDSRQSADNTTQANSISLIDSRQTSDNTTVGNTKAGLSSQNNFTASWNWFANVTSDMINATSGFFSGGINYITRINSNNQTLSDRITSENTTIVANLTSAGTRTGNLESRQSSDNTTLGNKVSTLQSDNTTQSNLISSIDARQSSDNATQGSAISTLQADNTTLGNLITGNNNTLTTVLSQRLNLTGGTLSGLLSILGFSTSNNLSLNVNNTLFVNASTERVGIGTSSPVSKLDVSGTLTVEGVNVTGRQSGDNSTTSARIGTQETKQSSDNTTLGDRLGTQETKQSSDNTTISNRAATSESNNVTIANNLSSAGTRTGNLETKQSSDNTTLSARIDSVSGGLSDNTTQGNLITGNNNTLTAALAQKLGLTGGKVSGLFEVDSVYALNNISVNLSNALFVNSTFGRVGINNRNPSSALDVSGTLTVQGINVTGRQESDNTTIGNRAGSLETKQSSDNTTLGSKISTLQSDNTTQNNWINGIDSRQTADNTTISGRIDSISGGTNDNSTQSSLITGNNNTLTAALGQKLNLSGGALSSLLTISNSSNSNNLSLNVSGLLYVNKTGDTGYIGIFTASPNAFLHVNGNATIAGTLFLDGFNLSARLSGNNQTLSDRITSENTTIAANLSSIATRIGSAESRQSSDNTTISGNLSTTNARIGNLEAKDSSDNTTQSNLITGNNNTISSGLGQKLNLSGGTLSSLLSISASDSANNLSLSVNGTLYVNGSGRVGINTTNPSSTLFVQGSFNVSAGISCGMITGGTDGDFCIDTSGAGATDDNTTQSNLITGNNNTLSNNLTSTNARVGNLETRQSGDNATLSDRISTHDSDNTTQSSLITGNNNTLLANLGQKLNLTGGTLSSLLSILGASSANNLSLNVNNTLYVNASSDRVGIGTSSPASKLDVSGTLTVEGINVTGRQISDNVTLANRITSENTTIAANLTAIANRIATQESDNTTQGNLITTVTNRQSSDNTTLTNSISGFLTASDNNTLTNLKANLTTFNNFTASWNWFANVTADSFNATRDFFAGGVAVFGRINSNNQTVSDRIGSLDTRQSGDNTTVKDNLTSAAARLGTLETKQSADNSTISSNITTTNARIGNLESKQASDNTTLSARIDSVSGGTSDNTTQGNLITGNNNTLTAFLGQKLNLTGGTLSGLLAIGNVSAISNLSLNVSGALYVNSSQERVGIGTTNPSSRLDVSGTLTVEGVNVTGRQISDNSTISGRITSENTTIAANLSSVGTRIGSLESKQSSDNTTITNAMVSTSATNNFTAPWNFFANITTDFVNATTGLFSGGINYITRINSNNQTLSDRITSENTTIVANLTSAGTRTGNLETKQSGDNTTLSNRITSENATIAANLTAVGGRIGSLETKQSADNTTLNNLKLSITGGALSGLLSIGNVSSVNNLSLNVSGALYVNSSIERVGIGTTNPSSRLDVSGTLTVEGVNVTGRQNSDNTTISGRITSENTTIAANLTTLANRISAQESNNNTQSDALNLKPNLTTANNFTSGEWHYFGNLSARGQLNASSINISSGISCGMITGGSDGDYCADSTGAGGTEDNTTQDNKITGNNNTLFAVSGQKLNLTGGTLSSLFTIANSSLANNLSLNVSGALYVNQSGDIRYVGIFNPAPKTFLDVFGNATIAGTLFLDGFNLSARLSGNNQTLSDRITSENTTIAANLTAVGGRIGSLESRQSSDNTTLTNAAVSTSATNNFTASWNWFANITADMINATSGFFSGGINYITRINSNNQTLSDRITSENTTIAANLTAVGGRVGALETKQSGDNTTLSNRITSENTTIAANLTAIANRISTQESNNVTQAALLGQKLNLTGGTLSSLLTIENSSLANNLSLNVSGLLYVNKTGDIGYIGLFNTAPKSLLDISGNATISGTLVLEGFNLSLRITSNNQTLADNITSLTNRFAGDNTTQTNLFAALANGNNQTLSNIKANITGDRFTGSVEISTITNLTLTTARLNVTQNTTISNTNNAGNNSAILFYDTSGACAARMYYNGTHFVIDGC